MSKVPIESSCGWKLWICTVLRPVASLLVPAVLAAQATTSAPRYAPWGVELRDMDTSVKPGDDFFEFAEGTWLRDHPIAADKVGAGYNYDLPDQAEQQVRAIVEEAAAHPTTPGARQIGDFYAAWMDEPGIEARKLAPLRPWLAKIDAVRTRDQLVRLMMQPGYAAPVRIGVGADQDDPTRYVVGIGQARLGLPARDYYLLKGEKYDAIRKAYRDYIVRLGTLAGVADPTGRADRIVALETQLAQDQWTPEQRRDPVATHNPMTVAQLQALSPQFDWQPTLASIGLPSLTKVDVAEKSAVAAAGQRLGDVALQTWKDWVAFRFVSDHAAFLPHAFDQANFDFYSHTLRDVPEQRARWKRGMALIDGNLGEAVGRIYVERHWSPDTERKTSELVGDMRAAYQDKIEHAAWMDEATRKAALAKLATFDPRVGHPVHWIDYSSFPVSRTDPLANDMASDQFQWRRQLSFLPHAVDRTLWDMTPQTGERLLRSDHEPDHAAGRDPAAAVLRSRRRSGRQLCRDRCHHDRPRDGSRFRRRGAPVRRKGPAARLVDRRHPPPSIWSRPTGWRTSSISTSRFPACTSKGI